MRVFLTGVLSVIITLAAVADVQAQVLIGAHVGHEGDRNWQGDVEALEGAIGQKLAIDSHYESWGGFPDLETAKWDIAGGRMPMFSWRIFYLNGPNHGACATASNIVAGKYDMQLKRQALQIKSLAAPVLVRFNYEMTGNAQNTCFTGFEIERDLPLAGQKYIVAWRHIVDIFRRNGATNVRWVWAPGAEAFQSDEWTLFYPGSDYVDWIGADQYNQSDVPASFSDNPAIQAFVSAAAPLGKPLMVSETAALNDPARHPDAQMVWLATARLFLRANPEIRAFVYWDAFSANSGLPPSYQGSGYVLQGPGLTWFEFLAQHP